MNNPYFELVKRAGLNKEKATVLDVGAGGFCGSITTIHLASHFKNSNISLIELDNGKYNALCGDVKFKDCRKIRGDFFNYDFGAEKYDLISVDLDSAIQFLQWDDILKRAEYLLKENGHLILYTILNMKHINMLCTSRNTPNEILIREHLNKTYNKDTVINKEDLQQYFSKSEIFEFANSTAKNELIQWLLLKKKSSISTEGEKPEIKALPEQAEKILTVALPAFNAKNIAWLAMESLCHQTGIDFDWEIVIMEEANENAFTKEAFLEYEERLKELRCIRIKYVSLPHRITLSEKWKRIWENASKNSVAFLLQACDCYSYPQRLKTSYDAIIKGFDWVTCKKGCFYEVSTGRMILYDGDSLSKAITHLNMGFKTEFMKALPVAELLSGIDGFLFKSFASQKGNPLSVFYDESENWKYGVDTHGLNNISKKRGEFFDNIIPPFVKTDIKLSDITPPEITEKLETYLAEKYRIKEVAEIIKDEIKPFFNIIVRTCNREAQFKVAMESILGQSYKNYRVLVCVDTDSACLYANEFKENNKDADIRVIRMHKPDFTATKEPDDKQMKYYEVLPNLYFNQLHESIKIIHVANNTETLEYIIYIDDDDMLTGDNSLAAIAKNADADTLIQWKVRIGLMTIPFVKGEEPKVGHCSGIGFCFSTKNIEFAEWDSWSCSDFRVIQRLWNNTPKKIFIDEILTATQRTDNNRM